MCVCVCVCVYIPHCTGGGTGTASPHPPHSRDVIDVPPHPTLTDFFVYKVYINGQKLRIYRMWMDCVCEVNMCRVSVDFRVHNNV